MLLLSLHSWLFAIAVAVAACVIASMRRRIPWRAVIAGVVVQGTLMAANGAILRAQLDAPPYLPDEAHYLRDIERIATAWDAGERPSLSSREWLGSLHTAYHRVAAALWLVGLRGRGVLVGANLALLAVAIAMFAAIALRTADELPEEQRAPAARGARAAAWWFALLPTHAAWASFALRDTLHLVALLGALAACLEARRTRRPLWMVAGVATLLWLGTIRIYSALFLAGAAALLVCLEVGRRAGPWAGRLLLLFCLAAVAALVAAGEFFAPALDAFTRLLVDQWQARGVGPVEVLAAIPRLLLGPYAWVPGDHFTVELLLYPGQWVLYLAILPAALAAAATTSRERREPFRDPLVLLGAFGTLTALTLLLAHGGDAPRQWYPANALLCLAVPHGLEALRRRPRLYGSWLAALAFFIVLQVVRQRLSISS